MGGSTVCFDPSEAEIGKDKVACYNHPCKMCTYLNDLCHWQM